MNTPNELATVDKSQITMLLIDGQTYNSKMIGILKYLSTHYDQIAYVTLNRPCSKIIREFEKYGMDKSKFSLISIAPKDISVCDETIGCEYVEPGELTDLSIKIRDKLDHLKPDVFIFDSMHTMLAYQDITSITKFAHDMILKIGTTKTKAIFPLVLGEKNSALTNDLEVFMDEVVEI